MRSRHLHFKKGTAVLREAGERQHGDVRCLLSDAATNQRLDILRQHLRGGWQSLSIFDADE